LSVRYSLSATLVLATGTWIVAAAVLLAAWTRAYPH
jgi:membrane protein GlpM